MKYLSPAIEMVVTGSRESESESYMSFQFSLILQKYLRLDRDFSILVVLDWKTCKRHIIGKL